MDLQAELVQARKQIVTDGYEMSIGELISLYRSNELIINPAFQRYFRWDESQKTRFIESLLLGIPIPPIFVFQTEKGVWELVDGLQRLSTIFEFTGTLRTDSGEPVKPLVLDGTKLLPSLADKVWEGGPENSFTPEQRIEIKRARIRIEILKKESDAKAKYELFQRLNTGGSTLSEQEVRKCTMIMINPKFNDWISELSKYPAFAKTIDQTETAEKMQSDVELALRFIVYRNVKYIKGFDVHEYIDEGMLELAGSKSFPIESEGAIFRTTFDYLNEALGANSFKRWDGDRFIGKFLLSLFETLAVGVSKHVEDLGKFQPSERSEEIKKTAIALWSNKNFKENTGAGIRGTTRLNSLMPLAETLFSK